MSANNVRKDRHPEDHHLPVAFLVVGSLSFWCGFGVAVMSVVH